MPESIRTLSHNRKSVVYRLKAAHPCGNSVIAKWCTREIATIERVIYENVIPKLPLGSLACYGYLDEDLGEQDRTCWLFLEDAAGRSCRPGRRADRAALTSWVASLHVTAPEIVQRCQFPARGSGYYLEQLQAARVRVLDCLSTDEPDSKGQSVLLSILAQLDLIEQHWGELDGLCRAMPQTLTHGDLQGKNVRIRVQPSGAAVLPLDWETAGWGTPAPDLENVDVSTYSEITCAAWPNVRREEITQLADYGRLLRLIICITWETASLCHESEYETAMESLAFYDARLKESMVVLGWRI
jgi:hypothetical protein